jgi:hypothetical protein
MEMLTINTNDYNVFDRDAVTAFLQYFTSTTAYLVERTKTSHIERLSIRQIARKSKKTYAKMAIEEAMRNDPSALNASHDGDKLYHSVLTLQHTPMENQHDNIGQLLENKKVLHSTPHPLTSQRLHLCYTSLQTRQCVT